MSRPPIHNFTVHGKPCAWARPRAFGKQFFTDPKKVEYKNRVVECFLAAKAEDDMFLPKIPKPEPVALIVRAVWPMKGAPRKRDPRPRMWKVSTPDIDNVAKMILDALQGLAYEDDAQVAYLGTQKLHHEQGDTRGARVEVSYARLYDGVPMIEMEEAVIEVE